MPKTKFGLLTGLSQNNMPRRLQDYFNSDKSNYLPHHSRSLPKKKTLFKNKQSKKLSSKKSAEKKRKYQNTIKKSKKNNSPPQSKHKASRYEHSIGKDYDSPSKDHEELDFILAERPNRIRSNTQIETTIDRVYDSLTKNNLEQAIEILSKALSTEPQNYDLNYLLGVCHLLNGNYDQAINILDLLLTKKSRKNIYLLLSVCYKKMEEFEKTEEILNECLKKNPKFYEAYIYRGKLNLKLKKYEEAYDDFEKSIKLNPDKHIAYIGKGDCLRLTEKYDESKSCYAKALNLSSKPNLSILLRRAICNMELKRYELAFEDINEILSSDPENSEALYFKGLLLNKQSTRFQNEAIICYEQAIKFNTNKKAVTRSIYELTKVKIEHRDYYEALYTLERAQFLDVEERVLKKFKIFADGVTELMKKNFDSGIKILNELIEQSAERPVGNFLKPLVYSSLAYGYMSLSKFQQAKEELDKLEGEFTLDIPNLYNKFICEGIIACNNQKYEQSLALFSKAGRIMPSKIEAHFYKAVTLLSFISKLIPKEMKSKQREYLESAMKTVNKCEREIENNPSLYLVRSFLNYALGEPEKAIDDLDKCMSDSIKHLSIHYYLHGLILAEYFGKYEEAIEEFKKAINAEGDHKIPEIYLNKSKCLLILGEINEGFVDLQTYMSYKYSSPEIHIWAGHLLFYIGATEDAARAYSNINNIARNPEVLLYRAKCFLHSKNVINTLSNLKSILDVKYDSQVYFDYHVLDALRECSEDVNENDYEKIISKIKEAKERSLATGETKFGNFITEAEYQFYKAVLYFHMGNYENAAKNFQRALKLTEEQISEKVETNSDCLEFYKLSYNNIPFNYIECLFNLVLCEIKSGNLQKGIKKIKVAIEKCPESETKTQLCFLLKLLEQELRNQFDKKASNESDEILEFSPFPSENRLCSIFQEFSLPLSIEIKTRLYFCLPGVEKPDISPKFDSHLYNEFTMSTIEIKPEAPWIKRSELGVIFTDDVVECDIEISVSSEDSNKDNEDSSEEEENESNEKPLDRAELKKMFQLDPEVEAKLARLK